LELFLILHRDLKYQRKLEDCFVKHEKAELILHKNYASFFEIFFFDKIDNREYPEPKDQALSNQKI